MDWFRWWHGTVNDPKFQLIARRAKTTTANVIAIWACLLEAASNVTQCDATKQRGDAGSFSCDAYDVLLGIDEGICQSVIAQMEAAGMIKDGVIAAWEKRQPKREDPSAARTREYRERLKGKAEKDNVTQCDATVTQGDAPDKIRLDKRREDKNNPPLSPQGGKANNRFVKPTPDQVDKYCQERKNGITGQEFVDFYQARGWVTGKARIPMKDWKAAVRTWEQTRNKGNGEKQYDPFAGAI